MSERLPMAVDCRNVTYRYGQFTARSEEHTSELQSPT